ncbi:hypothetical protein [Lysinibacillus sp.]|uniref:hypothetical protein n=1 Tax=Lysinibacillus sp. TaxID=1869345 RepID=UPI00289BC018|nr:hypothetical protein [Lysinibacillus sp.]
MRLYENDEKMLDELYKIMGYIHSEYDSDSYVAELANELEDVVVKIREEIEI